MVDGRDFSRLESVDTVPVGCWRRLGVVEDVKDDLPVEFHDRRSRRLAVARRQRCLNFVVVDDVE